MFPLFHEPSLPMLFEEVVSGSPDPAKNFIVRMIVAIGLQRLETKWAGVADSYYLGALTYFEDVVRPMNLQTLQCCVLIGEYSLLTPTRTAAWYIVGLGVRLAQQLGLVEERTIVLNETGKPASPLEVDLKRRAFWAIATMDYGLAHALGRPAAMATDQKHFNGPYFLQVDDDYISHTGVRSGPVSPRKWIAIHFYNMRMHQLEIRRTLYLEKRDTPTSDTDDWFKQMDKKLEDWKNANPSSDAGSGIGEDWFKTRYNTMIVFLYRPSPQIPRPSARAAILCYDACEWNISIQKNQLKTRSVEITWVFTQTLFMAVNTILWSLSYLEVRQRRTKEEVGSQLAAAIECMIWASERWPGVVSAVELYEALSSAILQIYDQETDVQIQPSPMNSDRDISSVSPSPNLANVQIPLSALTHGQSPGSSQDSPPPLFQPILRSNGGPAEATMTSPSISSASFISHASSPSSSNATANAYHAHIMNASTPPSATLAPPAQINPLPSTYADMDNWQFVPTAMAGVPGVPSSQGGSMTDQWVDYEDDSQWSDWAGFADGIDQNQQQRLMTDLQSGGTMDQIETMIQRTDQFWRDASRSGSFSSMTGT